MGDGPWLWIVIGVAIVLGIFRPRWLAVILLAVFYVCIIGVIGFGLLILISKFFGSGKK